MHQPVDDKMTEPHGIVSFGWKKDGEFVVRASIMGFEDTPPALTKQLAEMGKAVMYRLFTMKQEEIKAACQEFDAMNEERDEKARRKKTMVEIMGVEGNVISVNFKGVE